MGTTTLYSLPKLSFDYKDLSPFISEEQLRLHHEKHHAAYVAGANGVLERIEKARREKADIDMKSTLKELSFHLGGHVLHTLFWGNLAPKGKTGDKPTGLLATAIEKEFGSFDQFKKEFTQAAVSAEGSGWAALSHCALTNRPIIMQIEKHNVNTYPGNRILLVLDVWEHAYYLDYKNLRAKFVEAFWNIVNWEEAGRRFEDALK
jgi:superoxide dismutase, Fe-Mn family